MILLKLLIDAHIHLDLYEVEKQKALLQTAPSEGIEALIAVSFHQDSAKRVLDLHQSFPSIVYPAFGWHPEQPFIHEAELQSFIDWVNQHSSQMVAIGEVGLPYYLRRKHPSIPLEPYVEVLTEWIKVAKTWDLPICLHAVYEDAPLVCDLLEAHSITKAHFHWFKGDPLTVERLKQNGYYMSVTPDIVYEEEIQQLVSIYPMNLLMVETDGPWPFEGPFQGKMTHPRMIRESVNIISQIKRIPLEDVYKQLYHNTKAFFHI
ncbi:TatD family hydrolase [Aeribacillus pallidus]|uniref:TatD family hydrolase n=1 Tax=Aeribacillus pallidus TaxID=33936 RepID=UPI003D21EFCB